MKDRALIVLVVVIVAHYGYPFVAMGTDEPEKWASWWFYILRGVEGTVLFYLVLQAFPGRGGWSQIGAAACWLGMFEEAQTAICGTVYMGESPPLWSGLCIDGGIMQYLVPAIGVAFVFLTGGTFNGRKT